MSFGKLSTARDFGSEPAPKCATGKAWHPTIKPPLTVRQPYSAADLVPCGEPLMGTSSGSGRAAVA
jgi:hypothetical protein